MLFKLPAMLLSVAAALAGSMVGAAAQDVDISSIVKAAPSQCLSLYPNVVTVKDDTYENGITVRSIANATIDFRGVTVRGQANSSSAKTMTIVRRFNNVCVLGGRHWGKQDPQVVPWTVGHATYGAGILFKSGSGSIVLENAVVENSLQDGITLGGDLASNTTFGMRGTYVKNTSDDGIQNDGGKKTSLHRGFADRGENGPVVAAGCHLHRWQFWQPQDPDQEHADQHHLRSGRSNRQ